jgi:uncharacterized protein YdhG (YjbR/CyaY superfamily)
MYVERRTNVSRAGAWRQASADAVAFPHDFHRRIDGYLARVSADQRAALQQLRKTIHAAAPGVEECISYGLAGVRLDGRMLVWFGASPNHCAFYPGGIVQEYVDKLAGYEISKGTIRFQPNKPLPATLVRTLVKARIVQNAARQRSSKRRSPGTDK